MSFDFINSKLVGGTVEGGSLVSISSLSIVGTPTLQNGGSGVSATFSGLNMVVSGALFLSGSGVSSTAAQKLYVVNGLIVSASA